MNGHSQQSGQDRNMNAKNLNHASNGSRNYRMRENENRYSRNQENGQQNGRHGRRSKTALKIDKHFILCY